MHNSELRLHLNYALYVHIYMCLYIYILTYYLYIHIHRILLFVCLYEYIYIYIYSYIYLCCRLYIHNKKTPSTNFTKSFHERVLKIADFQPAGGTDVIHSKRVETRWQCRWWKIPPIASFARRFWRLCAAAKDPWRKWTSAASGYYALNMHYIN